MDGWTDGRLVRMKWNCLTHWRAKNLAYAGLHSNSQLTEKGSSIDYLEAALEWEKCTQFPSIISPLHMIHFCILTVFHFLNYDLFISSLLSSPSTLPSSAKYRKTVLRAFQWVQAKAGAKRILMHFSNRKDIISGHIWQVATNCDTMCSSYCCRSRLRNGAVN